MMADMPADADHSGEHQLGCGPRQRAPEVVQHRLTDVLAVGGENAQHGKDANEEREKRQEEVIGKLCGTA
jgi:hypothetical protein